MTPDSRPIISAPNMIMIGAAGKNAGKTEFACRLIERHSAAESVIGLKIMTVGIEEIHDINYDPTGTVFEGRDDDCLLIEETDADSGKDTARMLKSGARKVYWLRVSREKLREGIEQFFSLVPENACIVCESNSARLIVEPGLFIVVKNVDTVEMKPSCRHVVENADKIIEFDGDAWSMPPDKAGFSRGRWRLEAD